MNRHPRRFKSVKRTATREKGNCNRSTCREQATNWLPQNHPVCSATFIWPVSGLQVQRYQLKYLWKFRPPSHACAQWRGWTVCSENTCLPLRGQHTLAGNDLHCVSRLTVRMNSAPHQKHWIISKLDGANRLYR